jgi:hypothetical protein
MGPITKINHLIRLLQGDGIMYDGLVFYCDVVTPEQVHRMNQVALLQERIVNKKRIIITHK